MKNIFKIIITLIIFLLLLYFLTIKTNNNYVQAVSDGSGTSDVQLIARAINR